MALPTILLILAAISIGATVIAAIVAIRSTREARSAIFPIVKEEEAIKAQRARVSILVWSSITALLLGGWLAALRFASPSDASPGPAAESPQPTATVAAGQPTQTAAPEKTERSATEPALETAAGPNPTDAPTSPSPTAELPAVTATSTPPANTPTPQPPSTPTPTVTATPVPPTATVTNTPSPPSPTPSPTSLADAARVPTGPARTPAPADVKMGPIQFAEEVRPDDFEPVNPGRIFSEDVGRVYAIYPFSGMEKGLDFTMVWYHNGVELAREESQWQYGDAATSYSFLNLRGPGLYKLELYVNDTVVATSLFEVQ